MNPLEWPDALAPEIQEQLRNWGAGCKLSAFETLMWRAEVDPRLRATVSGVLVLDRAPEWSRLVAGVDWVTRMVPRFRQRILEPPLGPLQLGSPTWVDDPWFSADYHLRRMRVAEPGTFRQVLDLCQMLAATPFDRTRPPWEVTLIEGLEGERVAVLLKMHHSTTDGLGFIQLLSHLHNRGREPMRNRPQPAARVAAPMPSSTALLRTQAADLLRRLPAGAARTITSLRAATEAAEAPLAQPLAYMRSLARVLAPPAAPPSPLLQNRSLARRFETHECALSDLKAAAKAAGGSLNDAFIAGLLGTFRRYHERFGTSIEQMPVALPISLRRAGDAPGGNRFAGACFAAPLDEKNPARLIQAVRAFVHNARAEPAIDCLSFLSPALLMLPRESLVRLMLRIAAANDLQASNVPGLAHSMYLAGARVTHLYPFAPLPGCAAMATLVSHDGICCIGVNLDPAAITDVDTFARCLHESFNEVLMLARVRRQRRSAA